MNHREKALAELLEEMADAAKNYPETKAAAGVLNALCGSILLNDTETLLKYCADYTTEKTEILKIMPVGKASPSSSKTKN